MFKKNDQVIIKHQKEQGVFSVENPKDPTDTIRVGSGEPVEFYVRISNDKQKNLGYHSGNLEKI
jgi:hypothetical protein